MIHTKVSKKIHMHYSGYEKTRKWNYTLTRDTKCMSYSVITAQEKHSLAVMCTSTTIALNSVDKKLLLSSRVSKLNMDIFCFQLFCRKLVLFWIQNYRRSFFIIYLFCVKPFMDSHLVTGKWFHNTVLL